MRAGARLARDNGANPLVYAADFGEVLVAVGNWCILAYNKGLRTPRSIPREPATNVIESSCEGVCPA